MSVNWTDSSRGELATPKAFASRGLLFKIDNEFPALKTIDHWVRSLDVDISAHSLNVEPTKKAFLGLSAITARGTFHV